MMMVDEVQALEPGVSKTAKARFWRSEGNGMHDDATTTSVPGSVLNIGWINYPYLDTVMAGPKRGILGW